MISQVIPFVAPAASKFTVVGELVRYGALLKDSATGRIVAHVQETGILQKALQTGLSFNPLDPISAVTGVIGVMQNEQIKKRLDVMQDMLEGMQVLQLANLASSVAGIGVTAAGTAIILHRLKAVDAGLRDVIGRIDALPAQWRDLQLNSALTAIETQLERLQEVSGRQDPRPVVQKAEETLHHGFNTLHAGIKQVVAEVSIDEKLLRSLLSGLALCGGAQIRALYWLDDKETAGKRARRQVGKLEELAFLMPRDTMATKLKGGANAAETIARDASEIRRRASAQPMLSDLLTEMNISGRTYLERVEGEEEQPLLLLPAATT